MAVFVDFFIGRSYLQKLTDFVEGEICRVLGVEKEIEKLRRTLARIGPFLQDADRRRHGDDAINTFVSELKDIMYDVEDIIDDCMLEVGQLLLKPHPSSSSFSSSSVLRHSFDLLSSSFSWTKFRHEIAYRIEEINNRLKEISSMIGIISKLTQQTSKSTKYLNEVCAETTPLEVKSDIVGTQIEKASEDLIGRILKEDKGKNNCTVFGIVGMGGIGKTTLARKIMNDHRIKAKFPIRRWLYVSKNYSKTRLLKQIAKDGSGNHDGEEGIQELEDRIVSVLEKNFFIVLDDMWSTDVWYDLLRNPILNAAADNGKILVTSRDETVVRSMKAPHIHHVERMNERTGWKLLRKIALGDEGGKEDGLDDIGIEIVKLCDGLPLAIKVIGGVLVSKEKTRREWEGVLKSDLWKMNQLDEKIPKALYLSYEDLPSHLKECFLSCALYNRIGHKSAIMRLWIAEGFISEQGNMSMEEIADEYYKQLLCRNLLQPKPRYADNYRYYMHDLLRALGVNLIGEEGILMTDEQMPSTNPLTKIRRLTLSNSSGGILTLPNVIMRQKCLRVLLLDYCRDIKTIEVSLLKRLKNLRILVICDTQVASLPDSLFELLHLRYLDLDRTAIHEIPEAIGSLVNLQTLNISWCKSLSRLSEGITKLCNLRCLNMELSPLTHLPKRIGRLTNLNHVTGFVIGHENDALSRSEGCDLIELQSFPKMRFLDVTNLERATTAGTSVLYANKTMFLRHLSLKWGIICEDTEEQIERAEKVCNELIPPSSIESLHIYFFPGQVFPDWMMSTSPGSTLRCLTYLMLRHCQSCGELPPLGRLPLLKCLEIIGAFGIKTIGREFLGVSSPAASVAFPKLEFLIFQNMPNWEEWRLCEGEEGEEDLMLHFPNLQECTLDNCPKLRAFPEYLYRATNLRNIFVSRSDKYTRKEYSRNNSCLFFLPDRYEEEVDSPLRNKIFPKRLKACLF